MCVSLGFGLDIMGISRVHTCIGSLRGCFDNGKSFQGFV